MTHYDRGRQLPLHKTLSELLRTVVQVISTVHVLNRKASYDCTCISMTVHVLVRLYMY